MVDTQKVLVMQIYVLVIDQNINTIQGKLCFFYKTGYTIKVVMQRPLINESTAFIIGQSVIEVTSGLQMPDTINKLTQELQLLMNTWLKSKFI